ncbi:carboxylesterase [Chloropicon primus]|uniref:Carboxylic ester hydrolase n=1 Tax=Chloropicon primus TaxID=1764295 RepID=A0A5B8MDG0_9CHLO|nr:carboxylesterase [Chloropicon primus]|mmetsp:Transcript_13102/g.36813  ORF Transcript_13102/g.36813 Transcript_13102/m.36813 type:complete len:573 (+) Transcript_13102:117-1835(+)|eukprot:QDZ18453.1 carboxylesterase [Chloropicon primus]
MKSATRRFLACAALSFFFAVIAAVAAEGNPLERTIKAEGSSLVTFRGVEGEATYDFKGIPFADPPLRFQDARPKRWQSNTTEISASTFGAACLQPPNCLTPELCPTAISEDCLYLNVFVPKGEAPPEGWPVLVWIHGGAFVSGTGGMGALTPQSFAEEGVLLVTINYRLGALGWLNFGELKGNYGLSDQRMALQFVRDHISSFGGDAAKVTVAGESAGAMSILAHLASPLAKGLFDQAIVESGTIALPYNHPTGPNSFYEDYMEALNCPQQSADYKACLRDLPSDRFLDALATLMSSAKAKPLVFQQAMAMAEPFYPVLNTTDLPLHPVDAFESGKFNQVPLLIGNNHDEGVTFVDMVFSHGANLATSDAIVEVPMMEDVAFSPLVQPEIQKYYPLGLDSDDENVTAREILNEICTDYFFKASSRKTAKEFARAGLDVYAYEFEYNNESPSLFRPEVKGNATTGGEQEVEAYRRQRQICRDKMCHADELQFVFNGFGEDAARDDKKVAQSANSLWSSFVKDPKSLAAAWPPFTTEGQLELKIKPVLEVSSTKDSAKLAFWDSVGYNFWPKKL